MSERKFKIEHVATVPAGWRIRTKLVGAHRVRIGYPPGRRRKGSGKVIEVLHPHSEPNPCRFNPAELVVMGANPGWTAAKQRKMDRYAAQLDEITNRLHGRSGYPPPSDAAEEKHFRWLVKKTQERMERLRGQMQGSGANPPQRNTDEETREVFRHGREQMGRRYASEIAELRADLQAETDPEKKRKLRSLIAKFGGKRFGNPYELGQRVIYKTAYGDDKATIVKVLTKTLLLRLDRTGHAISVAKTAIQRSNPAELVVMGANPHGPANILPRGTPPRRRSIRAANPEPAAELYEQFHGRGVQEIIPLQESEARRTKLTALGKLEKFTIRQAPGQPWGSFKFSASDKVTLASSPNGKQLYLVGGNQDILPCLRQLETDSSKDFVELGEVMRIFYQTEKGFDGFEQATYYHDLGEETGKYPRAVFDKLRKRIFFIGGEYQIKPEGIVN